MNRVEYVNMRNTRQMDMSIFYRYYLQKNKSGRVIDLNTFAQLFSMFLQGSSNQIISNLDSEFNVNVLTDKNGKELKIW